MVMVIKTVMVIVVVTVMLIIMVTIRLDSIKIIYIQDELGMPVNYKTIKYFCYY